MALLHLTEKTLDIFRHGCTEIAVSRVDILAGRNSAQNQKYRNDATQAPT
jgi:hypothetical protein